jgi:hypothetical protein
MAKYSKSTQDHVEKTMRRKKKGTLKSGSGKKVKSRKQAVAIALSEAREKGYKAPEKAAKKSAAKKGAKKSSAKKGAKKSSSATRKKSAAKKGAKKSAAKKSSGRKRSAAKKK